MVINSSLGLTLPKQVGNPTFLEIIAEAFHWLKTKQGGLELDTLPWSGMSRKLC